MLWVVFILISLSLGVAGLISSDTPRMRAALLIAAGLAAMQLAKFVWPDYMFAMSSLIWVSIGAYVANQRQFAYRLPQVGGLLMLSGLCYPIGKVAHETFGSGSIALLFADMFGIAALLAIGGPLVVRLGRNSGFLGRVWNMGYRGRHSTLWLDRHYRVSETQEK